MDLSEFIDPEFEKDKARLIGELSRLKQGASAEMARRLGSIISALIKGGDDILCPDFVNAYIKNNKIEIRPDGIWRDGELVRSQRAFFHTIHQDFKAFKKDVGLKGSISREEICLEFESILEKQWYEKQVALKEQLSPEPDSRKFDAMLDILTKSLIGQRVKDGDDIEYRLAKAFLAHFFWQAMMKLHRGPDSVVRAGNESVLMLVSTKQKTGKSTSVRHIIGPLDDVGFVWRTNFNRLEDQFSFSNLAYNYIAWFDDVDRSTSINMGRFKQIITDNMVSYRAMYSQIETCLPKMVTFIATSNKAARELMNDTTGLRRFHQIMVNNNSVDTGRGIDLDTLTRLDMQQFYKCVPLGPETPMFNYISHRELREYEESIRPKHVVELWLEDIDYEISDTPDTMVMPTSDLYDMFKVWCTQHGYKGKYVPTSVSFSTKMLELGALKGRTSKHRGFYMRKLGE